MRIGGEGGISVFQQHDADHYDERGRIKTVSGAQTGYFSPELDKLYVAVRKHESLPAEIRVYAPKAIDSERATARDSFSTTQRGKVLQMAFGFCPGKGWPITHTTNPPSGL
jgi:hypothetical protein